MPNEVIFEKNNSTRTQRLENNSPSGLIGLVVKMGIADNVEKANYVLLGVFVVILVITAVVIIFSGTISFSKPSGPDKATLERMMQPPPSY